MNSKKPSVLITGASRGLGRALAVEFAARGSRVVITSRNRGEIEQVEREIRQKGGEAFGIESDISKKGAIYPLVAQAAELAGPIDILVNNASSLGPVPLQLLSDTECEHFEEAFMTGLLGPFRLTKALVGSMVLRRNGLVINISSDAAVSAYPGWGAYSVTKAGLDHLTRIWAAEFKDTAVQFISIDPGEMNTRMHADAIPDADKTVLADPKDVARKLVELALNEKKIISGSRIVLAHEA